ncbi:hypothetical protein Pmani_035265, partial [Petrolisthes manimaculis]
AVSSVCTLAPSPHQHQQEIHRAIQPEFNLRHDWNSLLSHDPSLLFQHYSSDFFPDADAMVRYLNDYTEKLGLRVNTTPKYVVVATGVDVPNIPTFPGSDLLMGYEHLPTDPTFYQGKNILILGRGNAAFETADAIYGNTNMVHMVSRSRARMAWNTHYVGDLRAVNNGLLDTYQLKSLDGVLEASVEEMMLEQRGSKVFVMFPSSNHQQQQQHSNLNQHHNYHHHHHHHHHQQHRPLHTPVSESVGEAESDFDNFSLREGYHYVLRCLGFKFDFSLFHNSTVPGEVGWPQHQENQVPRHQTQLRSQERSRTLLCRHQHTLTRFPKVCRRFHSRLQIHGDLLNVLVARINQGSATYQMFGVLADIVLFRDEGKSFEFLEEFPMQLLARLEEMTGRSGGEVMVLTMEYGPDFSGPDKDTFRTDRATGDPLEAHRSNFLHPVLYYYRRLPTEAEMLHKWGKLPLPRPARLHHVLEDFNTLWTAQESHILPLRRFLETVTELDLRHHYAHTCLLHSLTRHNPPPTCIMQGRRNIWHTQGVARLNRSSSFHTSDAQHLRQDNGGEEEEEEDGAMAVFPPFLGSTTATTAAATPPHHLASATS